MKEIKSGDLGSLLIDRWINRFKGYKSVPDHQKRDRKYIRSDGNADIVNFKPWYVELYGLLVSESIVPLCGFLLTNRGNVSSGKIEKVHWV